MFNDRIVSLLANILPGLTHPGTDGRGSIQLPVAAFRAADTLPPEVAQQFADEAGLPSADMPRLFAEAIVYAIENGGDCEIVPRAEMVALRSTAGTVSGKGGPLRQVDVHCHCGAKLFGAQVHGADTDKPRVSGPALITALRTLSPECALGHRPL